MTTENEFFPIKIKGFEHLYKINKKGDVFSIRNNIILKPSINGGGYKFVILYKKGKKKIIRIHRILAEMFIENINNLPCINHKDENKSNNDLSNLEWCSKQYNNTYGTLLNRRQETRNKRQLSNAEKTILQFDKNMKFIKRYKSLRTCEYDCRNIVNVLKGKNKTAYGYVWRYE